MTIGRGAECSVHLNDTKKHVSRMHALVDLQGSGHVLTVTSQTNPVLLNGVKLGPGESAAVKAGDAILIGDFTVQLLQMHEAGATPGATAARQVAPSPFDFGLDGGGDTVPGDDPFKGLDDLVPAKPKPAAPAMGPDPFAFAPEPPRAATSGGLVDDLGGISPLDLSLGRPSADPLMGLLNTNPGAGQGAGGPTFNPQPFGPSAASLDNILGRGPATPVGQPLVDLTRQHAGGSSNIDHVQPISMAFNAPQIREARPVPPAPPPPGPGAPASAPDPFDGFDPFASLISPRAATPVPPAFVEPLAAFAEPPAAFGEATEIVAVPMAPRPAPVAAPIALQPAAGAGKSAALGAFLDGAGLTHLEVLEGDVEPFLRESGAIVRASVEGLIGLLLARSEMKKEMRAEDRTTINSRDNNPLKLMTDAQEAMNYLFDVRERLGGAFLPPVQAVQDACDDLRVHEIALMAGMRAAFQGVLKRFDPQRIEREIDKQTGAFTLNKKVKLWEAFAALHQHLSDEADDDLLKVFGKEFLGTYSTQVKKLRGG